MTELSGVAVLVISEVVSDSESRVSDDIQSLILSNIVQIPPEYDRRSTSLRLSRVARERNFSQFLMVHEFFGQLLFLSFLLVYFC